jgi:hypothetical protein
VTPYQEISAIFRDDGRFVSGIVGRLLTDNAQNLSDPELERVLHPCVAGPQMVVVAKKLRELGVLQPLVNRERYGTPSEPTPSVETPVLNTLAAELLREVDTGVRHDATVTRADSLRQYGSVLLGDLTARFKTANGTTVERHFHVRVQLVANRGSRLELVCASTDGSIQLRQPLTADQAHQLIQNADKGLGEVITPEMALEPTSTPAP